MLAFAQSRPSQEFYPFSLTVLHVGYKKAREGMHDSMVRGGFGRESGPDRGGVSLMILFPRAPNKDARHKIVDSGVRRY
jgi:hypothetical protein